MANTHSAGRRAGASARCAALEALAQNYGNSDAVAAAEALRAYLAATPFDDARVTGFHKWLVLTAVERKRLDDLVALRAWGLANVSLWDGGDAWAPRPAVVASEFSDARGAGVVRELVEHWGLSEEALVCTETPACRCAFCARPAPTR